MILNTLIVIALCSILYRLGGLGGLDKYIGDFDKYTRDIGIPLVCGIWMWLYYPGVALYIHLLAFGLMWGAISTYWDEIVGYDSYLSHGIAIGLAYLPYAYSTGNWIGFGIRAIVLGVLMGLWCKYFSNDWVEECFRGGMIGLSMPLLLLPF